MAIIQLFSLLSCVFLAASRRKSVQCCLARVGFSWQPCCTCKLSKSQIVCVQITKYITNVFLQFSKCICSLLPAVIKKCWLLLPGRQGLVSPGSTWQPSCTCTPAFVTVLPFHHPSCRVFQMASLGISIYQYITCCLVWHLVQLVSNKLDQEITWTMISSFTNLTWQKV